MGDSTADIVSAIATAGGVVVAILGYASWKAQRRKTLEAEVAGAALIAVIRTIDALKGNLRTPANLTILSELGKIPTEADLAIAERIRSQCWAEFSKTEATFAEAWERTQVYLAQPAADCLEAIWMAKADIHWGQSAYLLDLSMGGDGKMFWEHGFAESRRRELDALRADAERVLKPLAQLR